jgi:hypothetical protein
MCPFSTQVDPFCDSSFRVRVAYASGSASASVQDNLPGAYVSDCQKTPDAANAVPPLFGPGSRINGNLKVDVGSDGAVAFTRVSDGVQLTSVSAPVFGAARNANSSYLSYAIGVASGDASERIYGMGELEGLPKRESCDIDAFALPWARNGLNISLATAKFQVGRGCVGGDQEAASCPDPFVANRSWPCLRYPSRWPSALAAMPCFSTRQARVRTQWWRAPGKNERCSRAEHNYSRTPHATLFPLLPFAGVASFGNGIAQWSLDAQVQVDYWFTTVDAPVGGSTWDGRLDDLYSHYVDATGHAPMLPDYGGM